jgi:hypothetical protein
MASRGYREIVTPATDARPRDVVSSSILEPFIIDLLVPSSKSLSGITQRKRTRHDLGVTGSTFKKEIN